MKISRLGRIQKRLLILAVAIVTLITLLIIFAFQSSQINKVYFDTSMKKELVSLEQIINIENAVSRIANITLQFKEGGNYSIKELQSNIQRELTKLSTYNQLDHLIDQKLMNSILENSNNLSSVNYLLRSNIADTHDILFELDFLVNSKQEDKKNEHYLIEANNIYNVFMQSLRREFSDPQLKRLKQQIISPPITFVGYQRITELNNQLTLLLDTRNSYLRRIKFLNYYIRAQVQQISKISSMLLDEIKENNTTHAHNISHLFETNRDQLLFISSLIIIITLLLLYSTIGDLGKQLYNISEALQQLGRGHGQLEVSKSISLNIHRNDEIGVLASAYKKFEQYVDKIETLTKKLQQQNSLMTAIFETMRDGLSVFDQKGDLVIWNKQYENLIAIYPDIKIKKGMNIDTIEYNLQHHHVLNRSIRQHNLDYKELRSSRYEKGLSFEKHYPNGQIVELRSSVMKNNGFVTIYIDRTSRRALELKYQQAQKLEAIGVITDGIAHDFNNFLTVISGNVDLLMQSFNDEHHHSECTILQRERLLQINRICQNASNMISRLLLFSRRKSKDYDLIDPNEIVLNLYTIMKPLLQEQHIEFMTELQGDGLIYGDISELESALLNLISNSQKAVNKDGVIKISTANRTSDDHGDQMVICIHDNGKGMDNQTLEHLFEPFFTNDTEHKGTGLGLSMVYGAIRRAKGDITISSTLNHGCCVELSFDRYPKTKEPMRIEQSIEQSVLVDIVLLVDDNAEIRSLLSQQLSHMGYIVLEAENGKQALQYIESGANITHLISDIVMDEMDGLSLVATIQAKGLWQIKILLMSAHMKPLTSQYEQLSVQPKIIKKPWNIEEIKDFLS